ncbi:MAG TPA: tetratricopeptide repeat protein [Kofleriaceae bacterium]|nr:tetratricopeptide repeat protein [Kofleriaceae bacterium]
MAISVDDLWQRGHLRAATDASAAALALRTQPFRDDAANDADLATALHDHGTRCWHLARFDESERCLDRAYDLRQSRMGDLHLDTLATFERLAGLANYQGQFERAEERYQHLLDSLRGLEGNKGLRLAIARRNFSSHLRSRGLHREAREVMDQAKKVLRRDAPPLELLAYRKADAFLCALQHDYREALDLIEAALRDAPLPTEHPFLASARMVAARCLISLDTPVAALDLLDAAIPQLEAGYGDHPLVAIALHLRSGVRFDGGHLPEAIADLTRAVALSERFYPDRGHTHHWRGELADLRARQSAST